MQTSSESSAGREYYLAPYGYPACDPGGVLFLGGGREMEDPVVLAACCGDYGGDFTEGTGYCYGGEEGDEVVVEEAGGATVY